MSIEENKAIVYKLFKAAKKNDSILLNELVFPNYINHTRQLQGREEYIQWLIRHFKTFPDFHVTLEDIVAERDLVCILMTVRGTHKGESHGIAPTGKKMKVRSVQIYRIADGKIVEGWTDFNFFMDQLDFMKNLGAIEYTEIGKKLFPESDT
ncbi:MAG: ester cyclase [Candidatus Bathyarchaeota archaeon]|nr:MAG: ester cyclase [Candidatus Bathyarchaeota archaeon]